MCRWFKGGGMERSMTNHLIIDDNTVYEIDEECEENMRKEEAARKEKHVGNRYEKAGRKSSAGK